eukprot:scaffold91194_cov25-Prasinocladus_malaysianus.AAC.1
MNSVHVAFGALLKRTVPLGGPVAAQGWVSSRPGPLAGAAVPPLLSRPLSLRVSGKLIDSPPEI